VKYDSDTGQTIISGMGELHLEVLVNRLKREFNTQVNVGKPQVVYKETIRESAKGQAIFEKEVTGTAHFGQVTLKLSPQKRGRGNCFIKSISDDILPADFIPSIEQGVMESMASGVILGYPVVDIAACLVGAVYKESAASALAYKVAGSMACKDALEKAAPFLLEPVMAVEILTPETLRGGLQVITATVPLSNMFGYSTVLRSATQGRGTFTMHFSHYDEASNPPV